MRRSYRSGPTSLVWPEAAVAEVVEVLHLVVAAVGHMVVAAATVAVAEAMAHRPLLLEAAGQWPHISLSP